MEVQGDRSASRPRPRAAKQRDPMLVAVMGVLTVSAYFWYWLWTSAEAAEWFDERSASPFTGARWAIPAHAIGTLGVWFVIFQAVSKALEVTQSGLAALRDTFLRMGLTAGFFALVALIGAVGILATLRRLWRFIERHEHALDEPDPIRVGRMTFLALLPAFLVIPFLNVLFLLAMPFAGAYILHRTQRGLNRIWSAAREGYDADAAWTHPGSAGVPHEA